MLKVGLIGCGMMGAMHANCYKALDGVTLAAVADVRPEKAQELAKDTDAVIYGDGMELIGAADVDVIDICLPTYLHAKYALAAMDTVKYVMIEKPITLSAVDADALLAKQTLTGCQVQVGQVIRFWDEYVALRTMVQDGRYGKVVNANFRRLSPRPTWGFENWLLDVKLSGGAAQDLHIHDIDYVLSLFGEPEKLYSVKNAIGEEKSYVNTLLQYPDFAVSVEATWDLPADYPFTADFRVVFEKATVQNAGGKFQCFDADGVHDIDLKKAIDTAYTGTGNISDLGGYYNELRYFCDRAAADAPIEQATLADAVASLKFLFKELSFGA